MTKHKKHHKKEQHKTHKNVHRQQKKKLSKNELANLSAGMGILHESIDLINPRKHT